MGALANLVTAHQIPVGAWALWYVNFIKTNAAGFFNVISVSLGFLLDNTSDLLQAIPAPLLIAIFVGAIWFIRKSWKLALFVCLALLFVMNQGYWNDTVLTLALILYTTFFCMLLGVPIGVAAAHRPWLYRILHPILDLMQTLPTFVYLIPTLVLFWPRHRAWPDLHHRLRAADPDQNDLPWDSPPCHGHLSKPVRLSVPPIPNYCSRWSCAPHCR